MGVTISQQQKNEADSDAGNYDDVQGESYTVNSDKEYVEKRFCEQNNAGQYECPVDASAGESVASPCSCGDDSQFAQVATQLSIFRDLPDDVVCSSGNEVGMCSAAETAPRMVCIPDAKFSGDGVDFDESNQGGVVDCEPDAWLADTPLSNQDHYVEATDEYECWAGIEGYSETPGDTTDQDFFGNNLGKLAPASSWFDPVVAWAKPEIERRLASDPDFIPDPGPDCPCEGSDSNSTSTPDANGTGTYDCDWTVATSVDNINRLDSLALQPEQDDLFGKAVLSFSATGSWGGSHSAECVEDDFYIDTNENAPKGECLYIDGDSDFCTTSCPSSLSFIFFSGYKMPEYDRFNSNKAHVKIYKNGELYFDKLNTSRVLINDVKETDELKFEFYSGDAWPRNGFSVMDMEGNVYNLISGSSNSQGDIVTVNFNFNFNSGSVSSFGCFPVISVHSTDGQDGSVSIKSCPSQVEFAGSCEKKNIGWEYVNWSRCLRHKNLPGYVNDVCQVKWGAGSAYSYYHVYVKQNGSWSREYRSTYHPGHNKCRSWKKSAARDFAINLGCKEPYYCEGKDEYYISQNECKNNCQNKFTGYKCNLDNQKYETKSGCQSACFIPERYVCADGTKVDDPANCPSFYCPLTEEVYYTKGECDDACSEGVSCNAQSEDYEFEVAIQNDGGNDYIQELRQNAPVDRNLNATSYLHEDLILRQCVDRYKSPSLSFDDPQNYHFEFGPIDHLTFNYAAEVAHELPFKSHEGTLILPDQPPVYTGGSESVPRRPMFPDLDLSLSWADDDAVRLGRYSLGVGNIKPLAYYYECPQGRIEPGYDCNADPDPFGGTDWTVKGDYCFQHRCSEGQLDDPEHTYSGCGYVNDGSWE